MRLVARCRGLWGSSKALKYQSHFLLSTAGATAHACDLTRRQLSGSAADLEKRRTAGLSAEPIKPRKEG